MIKNITYEDKIAIQNDESVDRKNKVTDADMNEIKEVVNANADEQTTQNTDISNIKKEQETQNTNIEENNSKIVELQTEKAKLETELKEMQEDFYQNSIRGQASGEYIHVEDSSNCRARIGIGGNSEQETREGYNIVKINTDNFELTNNTIKNKSTTDGGNILTHIKLKAGQTITSNLLLLSKPSKDTSFSVKMGSGDVANLSFSNFNEFNLNTKQSKIYTATEDVEFDVKIWGNANKDIFEFQYWVTIGTEEKDYELYGAMPSPDYPSQVESCGDNGSINEVICNKNLLDKNLLVFNKWINGDNGTIMTSTSGNYYATEKYIPFNQYVGKTITSAETMAIAFYDSNKTFISINLSTNPRQVVVPSKTEYIRVEVHKNYYEVAQLELGSIATPYEEHQEQTYTIPTQQPFRAIGDTRDTFIKKNNKWFERHYISRKIFDGTETNCSQSTVNNKIVYNFRISKSSSNTEYGKIADAISSHFIAQNQNSTGKNLNRFSLTNNMVIFCTDGISTIDSFKTLLAEQYNAGTPVYIDYVLKEPLDIECTEEQSQILDELNNARTYKNVTNIYSTDEISPILSLDYAKDLETLLNNIQALAVNNASEGV